MIAIYFFIPSFLILATLFLSKHREQNTGTRTSLGAMLSRFDSASERLLNSIHFKLYQAVQSVRYLILVHLPEKGRVKINKTKEAVEEGFKKQKDVVMGRKELKVNGSSSFFLRKMTEHKNGNSTLENGERGKIEDESINNYPEFLYYGTRIYRIIFLVNL